MTRAHALAVSTDSAASNLSTPPESGTPDDGAPRAYDALHVALLAQLAEYATPEEGPMECLQRVWRERCEAQAEVEEDTGVLRVWRRRTCQAEDERDAARQALANLTAVTVERERRHRAEVARLTEAARALAAERDRARGETDAVLEVSQAMLDDATARIRALEGGEAC